MAITVVIAMIIIGAFAGMAAWVLGPAKGMMVATQHGKLPRWLSATNRNNAPIGILLVQAVVVCLLALLFLTVKSVSTAYWILSDLTAQLALIYYIILFAAAVRLRYTTPKNAQAFRTLVVNLAYG